jgi:hypothetical protein
MSDASNVINELIESIADGAPIDWEEVDKDLPAEAELRHLIGLLRLVADIGAVHRSDACGIPAQQSPGSAPHGDPSTAKPSR